MSSKEPIVPPNACGEFWQSDFGPLYCYLPKGHAIPHHAFGFRGLITWSALPPFEAHFYRAVAESMAEDLFRPIPGDTWKNAEMRCAICSHEWVATYHVETPALECSRCHHMNATPEAP